MPSIIHNTNHIDFTPYVGAMRFGSRHGVVLAGQLEVAAPPGLTGRPKAFLVKVGEKAVSLMDVLKARARVSVGGLRPHIALFDTAYGGLHGRLVSASKLPPSVGDIAASATSIIEAVLIDGLAFLVNDAETKYAESARRLGVIADQGLEREIDRVAGAGFLDAVKKAHAALGEAIGVGETPVRFARAELQDAVYELAVAIGDYGLQLAAEVDRDDPASVRRFREAMMPLDRYRADRSATPGGEEEEDGPPVVSPVASPTPVVSADPPPSPPLPSPFVTDEA
jgi:hypothetical protein